MARFAGLQTRFGEECGVSSAPTHWNVLSLSRAKCQGPPWLRITVGSLHASLITDLTQTLNAGSGRPLTFNLSCQSPVR